MGNPDDTVKRLTGSPEDREVWLIILIDKGGWKCLSRALRLGQL